MRDKAQVWTEQQERLLFAAQAVVNDAGEEPAEAQPDGEGPGIFYLVDRDTLDTLKAIVQEISDDAVKAIREATASAAAAIRYAQEDK